MKEFNRERFLFWLLAGVLGVQALFFGYGLLACSRVPDPSSVCPKIGDRFDAFGERTLAAVLGLVAGTAAMTAVVRKDQKEDKGDAKSKPINPATSYESGPSRSDDTDRG